MPRTYSQYCGIARALEILGERWTLLIVRDLLIGPRRFGDLMDGLPGIGTNMLAARLKTLEAAGVIRRYKLPPPAGSMVYELTDYGRELEGPVIGLGRWGMELLDKRRRGEHHSFRWLLLGMKAAFRPEAAQGVDDSYEFHVDDEIFCVTVHDGQLEVGNGPARDPDAVISTKLQTFIGLGRGEIDPVAAVRKGTLTVEGDPEAALRAAALFRMTQDPAGSTLSTSRKTKTAALANR